MRLFFLLLIIGSFHADLAIAQKIDRDCCICEKMHWKIKVTVIDQLTQKRNNTFNTYNGKIILNEKTHEKEEFKESARLEQYTYDEKGVTIRLSDDQVKRGNGQWVGGEGDYELSETQMTLKITATLAEKQMNYKNEKQCDGSVENIGLVDKDTDYKLVNLEEPALWTSSKEEPKTNDQQELRKYQFEGHYQIINQALKSASWWIKPMLRLDSESDLCHTAHCYMPIRVTLWWGEPTVDPEELTAVQPSLIPQEDLIMTAYGTGETIGKIFSLNITNPFDRAVDYDIPAPGLIPPHKDYQGYVLLEDISGSIGPGETQTKSVEGVCYDLRSGPVTNGVDGGPVSDWLVGDEVGPSPTPETFPPKNSHYVYTEDLPETYLTYPGTPIPFTHTIDISEYPGEASSRIIDITTRIRNAVDSMHAIGELITPFSSDPQKEYETTFQNAVWHANSILNGNPYTKGELEDNVIKQFKVNTGKDFEDAPEETQEEVYEGADDIWTSIIGVGEEAKVLYSAGKTHRCRCKSMSLEFLFMRERNGKVNGVKKKLVIEGSKLNAGSPKAMNFNLDLKKGDLFSFLVTKMQLTCRCTSSDGQCDPDNNWSIDLGKKFTGSPAPYKSNEFDAEDRFLDDQDEAKIEELIKWVRDNVDTPTTADEKENLKKILKDQLFIDVIKDLPSKRTFPWFFNVFNDCFGDDCGGEDGRKECRGKTKFVISNPTPKK
ncbi:MAG: hypothetical protein HKN16_13805 [Saprospiraceae bacterium]|nr:hypothetical protein [Saprospiraceae bacterium]